MISRDLLINIQNNVFGKILQSIVCILRYNVKNLSYCLVLSGQTPIYIANRPRQYCYWENK